MDLDGPQNDKGTYAIAPIRPRMSIRDQDVITWNSFAKKTPGLNTLGFMSQISPDGRIAVTTINEAVYVANFKNYGFLQVFYPTRGILAWYSRDTGRMESLPGADDPGYVHTNAVWTPDGEYLVFARAQAKDPCNPDRKMAEFANDPNETPIQYDLYRIPFNGGEGGRPEPIPGASHNGMSNSFPKVSPDGRWIVFVQCRNGQLMRPDSQLYIVPAAGGKARRMRCNTPLMNSWHSFSPNGRWLVFSSKSRSLYTQMFLTHLDSEGRDSPAILIEKATASNRAVNLPEFVNIPPGGLENIEVPAADFYRHFDRAWALGQKGEYEAAAAEWRTALEIDPADAKAQTNLSSVLLRLGRFEETIEHSRTALAAKPQLVEAQNNLGAALLGLGRIDEAIASLRQALLVNAGSAEVHNNLGRALTARGELDDAIVHHRAAIALNPAYAEAYNDLAATLFREGKPDDAIVYWQAALKANPTFAQAHFNLGNVLYQRGDSAAALEHWRQGLRSDPNRLPVLNQAAWVLATSPDASIRDGAEAVKFAERAARISGRQDPAILNSLAAGHAETGHFAEALETAHHALALAIQQHRADLAEALNVRIRSYERGAPIRDTQGR
jgi:tetratricopeptide (TPR) repeat protein